jgi:hypothetical protein
VNLRTSTAAELCRKKVQEYFKPQSEKSNDPELKPGFPCRQHYLCRQMSGFDHPVCMASREYVMHRLAELDTMEHDELRSLCHSALDPIAFGSRMTQEDSHSGGSAATDRIQEIHAKYNELRRETLSRECICRFLGNAGREEIRETSPSLHYQPESVAVARGSQPARTREPVTICPNPDIGYFDREYTLFEMMRHLYGTGPRLTPKDKPSAFEIEEKVLTKVMYSKKR